MYFCMVLLSMIGVDSSILPQVSRNETYGMVDQSEHGMNQSKGKDNTNGNGGGQLKEDLLMQRM